MCVCVSDPWIEEIVEGVLPHKTEGHYPKTFLELLLGIFLRSDPSIAKVDQGINTSLEGFDKIEKLGQGYRFFSQVSFRLMNVLADV